MPPHLISATAAATAAAAPSSCGGSTLQMAKGRTDPPSPAVDEELAKRAGAVFPGLKWTRTPMAALTQLGAPAFYERGYGARLLGADGREFVDLMCGFGCNFLGYAHPSVERAVNAQATVGACLSGPTERSVELAEELVSFFPHADWALMAKNGSDTTSIARLICRAHTKKRVLLVEGGAYHGTPAPWHEGMPGVLPEDHAHQINYVFNDVESLHKAAEAAGDDLAGIFAGGFSYPLAAPAQMPTKEFAQACRDLADRTGALLVLDDIRCTLRIDARGSWAPLGVQPDISVHCKSIANGHPFSAMVGKDICKDAAAKIFSTGTYWVSPAPMAAALEVLRIVKESDALERMHKAGDDICNGFRALAQKHGVAAQVTGPHTMPIITFDADMAEAGNTRDRPRAVAFATKVIDEGVLIHPTHNFFLSAAHDARDVEQVLKAFDAGLAAVKEQFAEC